MKLKAVLAVTAALSFGGAFAQANFSDVPAGHWAKDAVEKMAAQGCIIGFPDGTFRGNEGLTRYQAALILARCLQNTTVVGGLDNETVESLKNAVQELSSELAALGVRIADVEDNAATKDDVAVLEERIAALEEAAGDKGETVEGGDEEAGAEVQAAIDELVAADEAAAAQIEDLTGALDELVNQLEQLATAQDDLTSRVEALEAGTGEEEDNSDVTAALEDLAAGQDDLNGRVDELAATLDDVAVSIDDLNARVDELAAAGEENAAVLEEINARIEELAGAIDDVNARVDDLEGTVGDVSATVEGQTEQIESNAASIVALQDLTVLLNEDIVGLEDRISALESDKANAEDVDARFTNLNRDLTDLTNRVTVVETNLSDLQGKFNTLNGTFGFSVSGQLNSVYYVSRLTGNNFDIDRIIPGTMFSTGQDSDGDTKDSPVDYVEFGTGSLVKVTGNGFSSGASVDVEGYTSTSLSLTLDFANKAIEGKSAYAGAYASDTQAFNVHKVAAEFGLKDLSFSGPVSADTTYGTSDLSFYIKNVTTQFDINGAPIVFKVGPGLKAKFTDYVFDNDSTAYGDGYLATVDGSSVPGIGAFSPKIWVAYGSDNANDGNNVYTGAIRATISPVAGLTLGLNAGQRGTDNQAAVQSRTQVLGADLKGTLAGWNLQSEYAQEKKDGVDNTDSIFYAHADGVVGPVSLRADYWTIDPDFRGLSKDAVNDKYNVPFGDVQRRGTSGFYGEAKVNLAGFGVKGYFDRNALFTDADTNLTEFGVSADGKVSIISLGAYYDAVQGNKYTLTGADGGTLENANRVGVTAGVNLAGFDVKGYFQSVSADGKAVDKLPGLNGDNGVPVAAAPGAQALKAAGPFGGDQVTKAGVDVTGALGTVNLKAGFKLDAGEVAFGDADFDRTTIYAAADTTFVAGVLTVKPSAEFKNVVDADAGTDDTSMFKVGVTANTSVLDAPFKPSFKGSVSFYQNAHSDAATYTASELAYSLGVKADAFLFDKSTFALTYAGWNGKNRSYTPFSGSTAGSFKDNAAAGDITLGGIYGEWNYYDLNFAYGDFTLNEAGAVSNGQAFKISYKVKF